MATTFSASPLRFTAFLAAALLAAATQVFAATWTISDLGTLGSAGSQATALNASGQVAGWSFMNASVYRAYLHANGTMQNLGTLAGTAGAVSEAYGINASGQVVGWSETSAGFIFQHAFLYTSGTMQDLGLLVGTGSEAFGINASGQVVGYGTINGVGERAFLYENGVTTDLSTLPEVAAAGWNSLVRALAINDQGQIVGWGYRPGNQARAFLLTPTSANPGPVNPVPRIVTLAPSLVTAGSTDFTLTVNGSDFVNGISTIRWNGSDRSTTFVSSGELGAAIPAADVATTGSADITVFNSAPGGGVSTPATLTVTNMVANPVPAVTDLIPGSVTAGPGDLTLTVVGENLDCASSTILWNGSDRTATCALQAIGYFKASNTQLAAKFGWSVALSADGSTLAVSALDEGGAATGVGGNEAYDCRPVVPADRINCAHQSGAVYVFIRSGDTWAQQAYLKPSNFQLGETPNTRVGFWFGKSIALSADGNTLAVGAPTEGSAATGVNGDQVHDCRLGSEINCASGSGAAYVFTRSGNTWTQQAYVKASNTDAGDEFGDSVALSGDGSTLAVGAIGEDSAARGVGGNEIDDCRSPGVNCRSQSGAVYVFTQANDVWAQRAYIKASNTEGQDLFGTSVALDSDGNTLAIGATGENSASSGVNGNEALACPAPSSCLPRSGAVYVFVRSGSVWTKQAFIKASDTRRDDFFGDAVALSSDGNTLAVTATGEGDVFNTAWRSGAVHVYTRSGADWSHRARLNASNGKVGDHFGYSAALSGDGNTLAVGATGEDSGARGVEGNRIDDCSGAAANCRLNSGAVYVFTRSGSSGADWIGRYVKASNTGVADEFGHAVALSADGDTLAIGAPYEASAATGAAPGTQAQADNSAPSAGAVYLY